MYTARLGGLALVIAALARAPVGAEVRVFVTNEKSDDVTVIDGRPGAWWGRFGSANVRVASW